MSMLCKRSLNFGQYKPLLQSFGERPLAGLFEISQQARQVKQKRWKWETENVYKEAHDYAQRRFKVTEVAKFSQSVTRKKQKKIRKTVKKM